MQKISLDAWIVQVDQEVLAKTGMTIDDIDDWRYSMDYEAGLSPKRSAARAIRNAKEACGMA